MGNTRVFLNERRQVNIMILTVLFYCSEIIVLKVKV